MSKPGLVLDVRQAEQPGRLLKEVALLVRVLRAAHEADRVGAIDRHLCVPPLRDEPWGALDPITRSAIHDESGASTFSVAIQVSSRVFRIFCATRAIASSQEMSSQWSLPGAR